MTALRFDRYCDCNRPRRRRARQSGGESFAWHTSAIDRAARIAYKNDLKTKGCRMKLDKAIGRKLLCVMLSMSAFALGACSSSPPLFSADGRPTQQILCPAAGGWRNCTDNARVLCPGGYDVIDQSTGDPSNSMLVACRAGASQ
jgi:hypothetical protein